MSARKTVVITRVKTLKENPLHLQIANGKFDTETFHQTSGFLDGQNDITPTEPRCGHN
jgi:hypothetical protein